MSSLTSVTVSLPAAISECSMTAGLQIRGFATAVDADRTTAARPAASGTTRRRRMARTLSRAHVRGNTGPTPKLM